MYSKGLLCVTVFGTIFVATWAAENKIVVKISPELVLGLKREAYACSSKTGTDPSVLSKVLDWSMDNDKATKDFIYCICEITGFSDKAGHLSLDKMLALKLAHGSWESYTKVLNECNKITRGNPEDTLIDIGKCLHKDALFTVQ